MSTDTEHDVAKLGDLDFAVSCDAPQCKREAKWVLIWSDAVMCPHGCGPSRVLCRKYRLVIDLALARDYKLACPRHQVVLGRVRELLLRIEAL